MVNSVKMQGWGHKTKMYTKVKKQQDGLIALVKQYNCLVGNNNAPV